MNKVPNFTVVIEISAEGSVKYELDKDTNRLQVDRFLGTSMHYPHNYGYIPNTLANDGDPIDVLVLSPSLIPGCQIMCRTIGYLDMEDESGQDAKILAVPCEKIAQGTYSHIKEYTDLPQSQLNTIKHFFEHYKDLEEGKWVKVKDFGNTEQAIVVISKSFQDF